MTCECGVCTKIKRWRAALQIDTPEKEAAFGEMMGEWEAEATDADYYQAIMKGTWPNAEELLVHALERVRANAERTSSI